MFLVLEVLDKLPTPRQHLLTGLLLGATGFFACLRWPKALWLAFPLLGLVAWTRVGEYTDSYVGPAIWAEGGLRYAAAVATTCCLLLLPPVLGARLTSRHRHRSADPATWPPAPASLERARHRGNVLLDIGLALIAVVLPEWLWPPRTDDDAAQRFLGAVLLATLAILGLLAFGAWLTGLLVI